MLDKLFSKALTLSVNGEDITFNTLTAFEFALGGRTNVPASKLADLIMLSPSDLKREAKSIKTVEKRFVDILSRSIEQPGEIGKLVREIDIQVFSNDYDWRAIFKALNQQDEDYDELRRVAVVKYMQYLRSRQDVTKQTYKVKMRDTNGKPDDNGGPESAPLDDSKEVPKETSIFDSISLEAPIDTTESPYWRLPKGEAVRVRPKAGAEFEFRLYKHVFTFRYSDPMVIIDQSGGEHPLDAGKKIVGGDAVCNVVLGNGLRDVSRMHLMIAPHDDNTLRMTD